MIKAFLALCKYKHPNKLHTITNLWFNSSCCHPPGEFFQAVLSQGYGVEQIQITTPARNYGVTVAFTVMDKSTHFTGKLIKFVSKLMAREK